MLQKPFAECPSDTKFFGEVKESLLKKGNSRAIRCMKTQAQACRPKKSSNSILVPEEPLGTRKETNLSTPIFLERVKSLPGLAVMNKKIPRCHRSGIHACSGLTGDFFILTCAEIQLRGSLTVSFNQVFLQWGHLCVLA